MNGRTDIKFRKVIQQTVNRAVGRCIQFRSVVSQIHLIVQQFRLSKSIFLFNTSYDTLFTDPVSLHNSRRSLKFFSDEGNYASSAQRNLINE
jgi:hypothetical protein